MLRAVLDTNVLVSAALRPEGPPGRILHRFLLESAFEMVLSPAIMEETLRAFTYPKIRRRLRPGFDPETWLADLLVLADLVSGEREIPGTCPDPDDDRVLAAALEGRADCLVTGDLPFLSLQEVEGVRIVSPRAFLERLTRPPS